MYSRQDLFRQGFKKSSLEYAATKGWMNDVIRVYPGGPRLFTASQILELANKMKHKLTDEVRTKLEEEATYPMARNFSKGKDDAN